MAKLIRTTFSIPKELKERLEQHPEINWPEVFKQGLKKRVELLLKLRGKGEL